MSSHSCPGSFSISLSRADPKHNLPCGTEQHLGGDSYVHAPPRHMCLWEYTQMCLALCPSCLEGRGMIIWAQFGPVWAIKWECASITKNKIKQQKCTHMIPPIHQLCSGGLTIPPYLYVLFLLCLRSLPWRTVSHLHISSWKCDLKVFSHFDSAIFHIWT